MSLSHRFHIKGQKSISTDRPGAVVIGGDYQGLGVVRSLGKMGVPICVLDDEYSIARFSRYATVAARVPDLRKEENIVETLLELGSFLNLKGWVLFPTRDEIVAALSRYRHVLSKFFRVPVPEWQTVRWMLDKRNTYELARKLNIPIPRTWSNLTVDTLDSIDAPYPLVLKPAIKEHFFYATKAKAWRAESRSELELKFRRASALMGAGEILIQDMIPGDGRQQFSYCAFYKNGKAVGSMVARRRRQHPHDFGRASTFVETIDLPALETLSERCLSATDYYGLVEMEYKLDPRDGQFKLLDINPRTWGYHSLGVSAGVDFPRLLYMDQTVGPVEPCRGRPGVFWIRLLTDIPTGLVDIFRGRLRYKDYLASLGAFDIEAVFNREDPLPGLMECALLPYLTSKKGF
jgi:predicted ATP-grasp superfamily ATP-dependent carboligase